MLNIYTDKELAWLLEKLWKDEWYLKLSLPVRALVDKYPPGTYFMVEGKMNYVISYTEGKEGQAVGLRLSEWHPTQNYEEAKLESYYVCLDCLAKHILRKCIH